MSQYQLAANRPQGTANVRVFTPTVAEHGWSAGGHTVVEVVTDDMPFLVDSVTMELTEQGPRRAHGRPPAAARAPRRHRRAAGGPRRRRDDPVGGPAPRRLPRVVDARRDRPGERARAARRARAVARQGAPRRPRGGRGLGADARRRPARSSPTSTATRRRCPTTRSRRARRCSTGWPTTTSPSSATASTASRVEGDDVVLRAVPGTGFGILRSDQDMSAVLRQAAAAGARQGAREDPAGAGQGQLQGDRAPPGLPRLRRRQDVRRGRRGRRRAPLPRAVLVGRLHRVADPDPGDPARRPRRSSTGPGSSR